VEGALLRRARERRGFRNGERGERVVQEGRVDAERGVARAAQARERRVGEGDVRLLEEDPAAFPVEVDGG